MARTAAPTGRYPFYSDISKSNLQAVGSMHAWPVLLAMLTWLVELIVVRAERRSARPQPQKKNAWP